MEAAHKHHAALESASRDGRIALPFTAHLRRAAARIVAFADWYSEHCRRIRAYQELTRLDPAAFHAALCDPEQHRRILDGLPPRKHDRGN